MKKSFVLLLVVLLSSLGCNKESAQTPNKQEQFAFDEGGVTDPKKVNEAGEGEKTAADAPKKEPASKPTEIASGSPLAVAKADPKDARPQEPAKPQPKILQDQTWTWEGSQDNYAKYSDLVFEVGMGNERNGVGCADAGVEIENVRNVKISVDAPPSFNRHDDNSFAGFMVDYHTPDGYTKRVALSIGVYSEKRWTKTPIWGKATTPDQFVDLGRKKEYDLNLKKWAPEGWDGKVWFVVALQNTGRNSSLKTKAELLGEQETPQVAQKPKEEPAKKEERPTAKSTLSDRLAGTKWVNTNKVSFEWDGSGKFYHNGTPRDCQVVNDLSIKIVFGDEHIDTLVFNADLTTFEQFSTREPNLRPLFRGRLLEKMAAKPDSPNKQQPSKSKNESAEKAERELREALATAEREKEEAAKRAGKEKKSDPAKAPTEITAEFLPHTPGTSYYYDTQMNFADGKAGVFRRKHTQKAGGIIESTTVRVGSLNKDESILKGDKVSWLKDMNQPSPNPMHHRIKGDYIEIGSTIEGLAGIQWEPVLKIGAKDGDTWKWESRFGIVEYKVEFGATHAGKPAVVIHKTRTEPLLMTQTLKYAKGIGEVERISITSFKDGKKQTGIIKLVEEDEKQREKTDVAQKPKEEIAREIDPLVAKLVAVSSTHYKERGFKEYMFGSTKDNIEKKFGELRDAYIKPSAINIGWLAAANGNGEMLYFAEGKLVGVRKNYAGDNKGYVKAAIELLGKTPDTNISSYSISAISFYPRVGFNTPPSRTLMKVSKGDALYSFPQTIGYLSISTSYRGNNKEEEVSLFVYDREYFVKTLSRYVAERRQAMEWFKSACESKNMANLPKYPGRETITKAENASEVSVWTKDKQPELLFHAIQPVDGPPIYRLFHRHNPSLAESTGSVNVGILDRTNDRLAYQVSLYTTNALFSNCYSRLAQEYFLPEGRTISFFTNRPGESTELPNELEFKSHSWDAQNGETVSVYNTHTMVIKRSNVKRKLD